MQPCLIHSPHRGTSKMQRHTAMLTISTQLSWLLREGYKLAFLWLSKSAVSWLKALLCAGFSESKRWDWLEVPADLLSLPSCWLLSAVFRRQTRVRILGPYKCLSVKLYNSKILITNLLNSLLTLLITAYACKSVTRAVNSDNSGRYDTTLLSLYTEIHFASRGSSIQEMFAQVEHTMTQSRYNAITL